MEMIVIGVDVHMQSVTVVAADARAAHSRGRQRGAAKHAPGARVWAIEGAGHYGAGLARYLAGRAETVLEVSRSLRVEQQSVTAVAVDEAGRLLAEKVIGVGSRELLAGRPASRRSGARVRRI
jgi:transposase